MGKTGKTVICQPGDFEREQHYYQRALNAQIHPLVSYYLGLSPEALLTRYCHLNPSADKDKIRNIIQSKPKHFRWAGSDLFHVTTVEGYDIHFLLFKFPLIILIFILDIAKLLLLKQILVLLVKNQCL